MKLVTLKQILPITEDKAAVISAVKQGFIAHGRQEITMPAPVQMMFNHEDNSIKGDCHIKTAYSSSQPFYCVKIASGFYQNPSLNLPVNNGLVMLFSSDTGQPLALFQDDGYLTSLRTAAAGALSVSIKKHTTPINLGIIGTGHQAELQARWIRFYNPTSRISVWGRSEEKATNLANRLSDLNIEIRIAHSINEVCQQSNVIVTTTPSTSALVLNEHINAGHHIVALGSDSPGKVELSAGILARAQHLILDDYEQCLAHGEFGQAIREGSLINPHNTLLGTHLTDERNSHIEPSDISVVDLTGLGSQDLAIASMVWQAITQHSD